MRGQHKTAVCIFPNLSVPGATTKNRLFIGGNASQFLGMTGLAFFPFKFVSDLCGHH